MDQTFENRVLELMSQGRVVLITIIHSSGSTPRHAGTKALYTARGLEGTVGGGLLEAKTTDLAAQAYRQGQLRRLTFHLNLNQDPDMICGGTIQVLCEVLGPESAQEFQKAQAALANNKKGFWTLQLSGQDPVKVQRNFTISDAGPSEPNYKSAELYLEPLHEENILLLCGGGNVALEVAKL
ncbi:MAG: XdhC family protein, partial [Desulfovibrio sp.]|nr:XdhC family protein [Desulfovibrio sp.]